MDIVISMKSVVDDLGSKDTKRRLAGVENLAEMLRNAPPPSDQWPQLVSPLLRTLRDNNFKVCRAALVCLEFLVGHVGIGVVHYLSMIIPAVVECLGNSKSAVQEKGVDVLLAISDPAVNGAEDTLATLEQGHCFRHKNWRAREYMVKFLGRATEADEAGVCARPALAVVLAEALNDSAAQVRQEAMVATARVVELMGASLLTKLEARGVRPTQLSALRDSSQRRDSSSASSTADDTDGGDHSQSSPAVKTPAPSSRAGVASLRAGAAGSAGGSGIQPTAARRRRATAPTSARGVSTDTGGGLSPAVGASSPSAGGNSLAMSSLGGGVANGMVVEGEESAFSALEPLVPFKVYTEKDVRRELDAVKTGLEHGTDWLRWVSAMRRLAGVALGGASREFPALLVGLVRASVHEAVGHKVSENRSAVAREACRCVAVLARCLTYHFGSLAELWLPELLRNTTRAVVVAAAGDEAARAIFGCTTDGFPRLLPLLTESARNKSAAIRRRCLDYAMLALARWGDAAFERHLTQTRDMFTSAISDADASVRATARRAYWLLRRRFPSSADSIMSSLAPSMQRHVLREDEEFDTEGFVEAVTAAAENPQTALGENLAEQDGVTCADGIPVSRGSALGSSPRMCNSAPSAAVAARRMHGTHHSSRSPSSSSHQTTRASASTSTSAESSNSAGLAGMKSSRAKPDRVVTGGGAGSGKVARPGGGAPMRMRAGRLPLSLHPEAIDNGENFLTSGDGNAGFEGGGATSVGGAPLRVTSVGFGKVPSPMGSGGGGGAFFGAANSGNKPGALRVPRGGNTLWGGAIGVAGGPNGEAASAAAAAAGLSLSSSKDAFAYARPGLDGVHQQQRSAIDGPQRVARRPPITPAVAESNVGVGRDGSDGVTGGGALRSVGSLAAQSTGRVTGSSRQNEGGKGEADAHHEDNQQQQQRLVNGGGDGSAVVGERVRQGQGWDEMVPDAAVMLDRKDVLRQAEALSELAGDAHWATRVEALERLSELLTVDGGGDGGRFVLESRLAKRAETVIGDRVRDAHFKVVVAALRLLTRLVEAHAGLMAGLLSTLLPPVFPSLADSKEPVRKAASQALDACRAAYPPHHLCVVLCPRVLELAPGRAQTGLLEFLTVLVPHSPNFLANPGHLHALTQRLAVALLQSPPPTSWDTGAVGGGVIAGMRAAGGGGGNGVKRDDQGSSGSSSGNSAAAAYSAATRLLAALFRLDRHGLAVASSSLPPESAAAVRRALSHEIPDANLLLSPLSSSSRHQQQQQQQQQQQEPQKQPSERSNGDVGLPRTDSLIRIPLSPATTASSPRAEGETMVVARRDSPIPYAPEGTTTSLRAAMDAETDFAESNIRSADRGRLSPAASAGTYAVSSPPGFDSASGVWVHQPDANVGGDRFASPQPPRSTLQQQQQQHQRRQPLAPLTPRDSNTMLIPVASDRSGNKNVGGNKNQLSSVKSTHGQTSAEKGLGSHYPPSVPTAPTGRPPQTPLPPAAVALIDKIEDPAEAARRLISGLSPSARTHEKISALSSLRALAEGGGAGGHADFWPRYFGQVLNLLLEGATAAAGGGGQGGMGSSPSRKRAVLAAKHVQGVRCLVSRRGELFPGTTEVVVDRLVEIGGGGCHAVRHEAEACLADLVAVLDPSRFLAVLIPLLLANNYSNSGSDPGDRVEMSTTNPTMATTKSSVGVAVATTPEAVLIQCVVLGALQALTPRLSSPALLSALGAGPLLSGLESALSGRDLEARRRAVLALVEMYQVLEEALLPFLSSFPTSRLKLITMYIEQRRAKDQQAVAANEKNQATFAGAGGALRGSAGQPFS